MQCSPCREAQARNEMETRKHKNMKKCHKAGEAKEGSVGTRQSKKSIVSGCKSGKSFASFTLAAPVILLSHRHFIIQCAFHKL